ncbi:hypothetical protein BDR03DRAFT_935455 [Suillus americanus]|nr:hypothetical protein BDR03DRAFT_935455 [Suillus americanus]
MWIIFLAHQRILRTCHEPITSCAASNLQPHACSQDRFYLSGLPAQKQSTLLAGLPPADVGVDELFHAFTNPTCGLMMAWQYYGTNAKSFAKFDHLGTFFEDPLFRSEDAIGITHAHESKLLDKYLDDKTNPFREEYGWQESMARIHLPKEKQKWASEEDAPELQIPGVYHRSLVDIITAVFKDDVSQTFNMMPFSQHWKVSEEKTIQVFSEAHSSPVMLDAYMKVNALPRKPDNDLERVVASLIFLSDSTHLTNFGDASMWPFYLFFGNQSKYTRRKPTASACHHVAYIPNLPDDFQEQYMGLFGEPLMDKTVWMASHIEYSLDFLHTQPTIRKNRLQCVNDNSRRHNIAKVRSLIFEKGAPVSGTWVNGLLNDESLVPTRCTLLVFEGLLPNEHGQNTIVLDLLFDLAAWQGYAKLHLHTDNTLAVFDTATVVLGEFYAARGRQAAALASQQTVKEGKKRATDLETTQAEPKLKRLNLKTYKYHALGDYPNTIQCMGTTDNFSTQTSRKKCQCTSPSDHYHISKYPKTSSDLTAWLSKLDSDDPAKKNFIPQLKDHLLARLQGIEYLGDEHDFTNEDWDLVIFANNQIHKHGVLQANYTTYDLRREQDTINPRTHADIMVIRILHLDVWYYGDKNTSTLKPLRMDVLFVRWFARDVTFKGGWSAKHLHRLGFFTGDDPGCFGFLDPDNVICGVHLIPAFAHERTDHYMGPSFVHHEEDGDTDWRFHYVNIFVDRDMFMHFRGGGVGHKVTREWDNFLQSDRAPANTPDNNEEWDDVDMDTREDGEEDGEEEEGELDEGEDEEDEEDPDNRVEADSDEGLDDDVLAREGYGAL